MVKPDQEFGAPGTRSMPGVSDKQLPDYPPDHQVGMEVPQGGSDCAKCEYVDGQNCKQEQFIQWNGSEVIPVPTDRYCCDFFEAGDEGDEESEDEEPEIGGEG